MFEKIKNTKMIKLLEELLEYRLRRYRVMRYKMSKKSEGKK